MRAEKKTNADKQQSANGKRNGVSRLHTRAVLKEAFELKDEKKKLIKEVREEIDGYFEI